MNRLIIIVTIPVSDMDRAKTIKEALEILADNLPESAQVTTRYDETPAEP